VVLCDNDQIHHARVVRDDGAPARLAAIKRI